MKKIINQIIIIITITVLSSIAFGSTKSTYNDYPRLIITSETLNDAINNYNNLAFKHLKDEIIKQADLTPNESNSWDNYAKNARIAQAAAFRYILGDTINDLSEHLGDKAKNILLYIPNPNDVLPANINELIFSNGANKLLEASKAIICYCTAWDLLMGSSYIFGESEIVQSKIELLVSKLYNKSINDYQVNSYEYFNNNVGLKIACAIGIAGITFNTNEEANDWVNHGLTRYNNILNTQASSDGGWAEGFDYLQYAATSLIPFAWAHGIITNLELSLGFETDTNFEYSTIINDPRFKKFAEWSIKIRMPDGRRPNIDDGRYDGYFTDIFANLENEGLFNWDYNHTMTDLDFQDEIVELRLVATDPAISETDPQSYGLAPTQFMPDEGLAILRTDWSDKATYMLLVGENNKMRKSGYGHEHADATSFILAHGKNVLAIDSGYDKFSNHNLFNKASDHNRIAIENEELINQTYNVLYSADLNAYIENYVSLGDYDYLEVSIRESTNPDFVSPKLIGPNTTRHVIFDRSYAYDEIDSTTPFFIIIDRVTNDHSEHKNFIWRLHGHNQDVSEEISANQVTWSNIGTEPETSKLRAFVSTVSGTESVTMLDDSHAEGWNNIQDHKVMNVSIPIEAGATEYFLSILHPAASDVILPEITDNSIANNLTKSFTVADELNTILVQNTPSFLTSSCSESVENTSTDGNFLFTKTKNDNKLPITFIGQNVSQISYNGTLYFTADSFQGVVILHYEPDKIIGYFSTIDKSEVNLEMYTAMEPTSYSNIDESTVTYEDGYIKFNLSLLPENDDSNYYKAKFTINGINIDKLISTIENNYSHAKKYKLLKNYPNPFNPFTTIQYFLKKDSHVQLKIYNINGEEVIQLINDQKKTGLNAAVWNGCDNKGIIMANGIYLYVLQVDGINKYSNKMILLK